MSEFSIDPVPLNNFQLTEVFSRKSTPEKEVERETKWDGGRVVSYRDRLYPIVWFFGTRSMVVEL